MRPVVSRHAEPWTNPPRVRSGQHPLDIAEWWSCKPRAERCISVAASSQVRVGYWPRRFSIERDVLERGGDEGEDGKATTPQQQLGGRLESEQEKPLAGSSPSGFGARLAGGRAARRAGGGGRRTGGQADRLLRSRRGWAGGPVGSSQPTVVCIDVLAMQPCPQALAGTRLVRPWGGWNRPAATLPKPRKRPVVDDDNIGERRQPMATAGAGCQRMSGTRLRPM